MTKTTISTKETIIKRREIILRMNKKNSNEIFNLKEFQKEIKDSLYKTSKNNKDESLQAPKYSTGIFPLDKLLNGGFPQGRIIGLGAEWGVGKTTMLIQACGNIIEKHNKNVYYIDVEGGATYELFESMGYANLLYHPELNPNGKLYLLNLDTIQEIAKIVKKVTRDDDTAIIVIDSDTQVVDGDLLAEDDLGASNKAIGNDARMWSRVAKSFIAVVKHSNACLIVVHQARERLTGFVSRIEATGGNAIRHMVSVEIWGKQVGWIMPNRKVSKASKDKARSIGALVKLTTNKNRFTTPFATVDIPIFFGKGVSVKWFYKEWLENHKFTDQVTGVAIPFIRRKGTWIEFNLSSSLSRRFQGEENLWKAIDEYYEEIKEFVNTQGGLDT